MTQLTPQEIAAADQIISAANKSLDQIIDIAPEATDLITLGSIASTLEKELSPHVITMALILAANRIKENQSHP